MPTESNDVYIQQNLENISFSLPASIQFDIWLADLTHTYEVNGLDSYGVDTFPLGIGYLASYCESELELKNPIRLFRYTKKLNDALKEHGLPKLIGFSNYIWNSELSYAVARCLKKADPDIIIVCGGPNFPLEATKKKEFFEKHPEIDFFVTHEGEVAFKNLLTHLALDELDVEKTKARMLPSVHALDKSGKLKSNNIPAPRIKKLSEIPSPFTSGKFDEFFDGKLRPLVQTKRGCPFACTYCTEGEDFYSKMAKNPVNRVAEEMEYIGKKMAAVKAQGGRCDMFIADSNFGMFKDDVDTAEALARTHEKYGWPEMIYCSTGKNNKKRVLEVAEKLEGRMIVSGSVQSLDELVLDNIKRKNIAAEELLELAKEARNVDANSYCEIIMALPGENKKSHFDTLEKVINAGFNYITPYQFMVLDGSHSATAAEIDKYQLKLKSRVLPRAFGSYEILGEKFNVADIEDIVVATADFSFEDYLECRRFHLIIFIFYNDVVFSSTLKYLRDRSVPIYDWLKSITDLIDESEGCRPLIDDFYAQTNDELFDSHESLQAHVHKNDVIGDYFTGKRGYNLLHTFKAKSMIDYADALASVALQAAKTVLEESDPNFETAESEFLSDLVRWDQMRATDILEGVDRNISGEFKHDIQAFSKDEGFSSVDDYQLEEPREYTFKLSTEQQDYVNRYRRIFGTDSQGLGRIMASAFTEKLLRNVDTADDELDKCIPLQMIDSALSDCSNRKPIVTTSSSSY